MTERERYYQILGLKSEATEEEIRQAYRDLVNVWHPDRFSNNPRLRNKANEKIKEINIAYEILTSYIVENSKKSVCESQRSSNNTPPGSGQQKTSTGKSGRERPKTPANEPPSGFVRPFILKSPPRISWKLLALCFGAFGFGIGVNFSHELIGAISGLLIGMIIAKLVNRMNRTRIYKIMIAWGAAIFALLLFLILFDSTTFQHARSNSSITSSLYKSLASNHPTSSFDSAAEKIESEEIGLLFECIRQANLQKDIDLFMSCFSRDFSSAETKRRETLKLWDTFNYSDLSYQFKKQIISGDAADVRLEWTVEASEKLGGKPRNARIVLDVALKREDGHWKIIGISPVDEGSIG